MSTLWLDLEIQAEREERLLELFVLAREEEGRGDDLPPIIQDEVPESWGWDEAA